MPCRSTIPTASPPALMLCLLTGTRLFLYISPLRYRAIPEIAYRRNCTYLFGTSTFLSYYARHADPLDFHRVRYVISGGEKLGEDVARLWLEKFGLRIYQGYGATECAPVIALSTPAVLTPGTVGPLLPGHRARLERVEGIERGGVLHLRGPRDAGLLLLYDNPGVIEPPRSDLRRGLVQHRRRSGRRRGRRADVVGRRQALRQDRRRDGVAGRGRGGRARSLARPPACCGRCAPRPRAERRRCCSRPIRSLNRSALVRAARELGGRARGGPERHSWMPEIPLLATGKTDYVTLQAVDMEERAANDPAALILKAAEPTAPYG